MAVALSRVLSHAIGCRPTLLSLNALIFLSPPRCFIVAPHVLHEHAPSQVPDALSVTAETGLLRCVRYKVDTCLLCLWETRVTHSSINEASTIQVYVL
jgi:hypothetical protein